MGSATQVTASEGIPSPSPEELSAVDPARTTAIVTGVLFIVATVASVTATALEPALTGPDYLGGFSAHPNQAAAGAFLYIVAALASAAIAVALYPVLKATGAGLALGSVVFRSLEAAMYLVGVVALLSLLTLGDRFAAAGAADRTSLQTIGDPMVSVRDHASLVGVFAFCLGALLYYHLFYRSRLIPRWLSGWGIAGIFLMLVACMMALFSDNPVTGYVPLAIPIGLQEMVLAAWLIIKGFGPPPQRQPTR
jgi:Domain of unknown function (DUF4386)